jgi:predicted transcriptional regulator
MNKFLHALTPFSRRPLGPLERRLLDELWSRGNATVRELVEEANLEVAYTTVMTTLDRLYKKRLLQRIAEGKAFRYSPSYTRQEFARAEAGEAILQLLESGAASLPLSYLVEILNERDARLLDDLQRLIEAKRRELQSRTPVSEEKP